MKNEDEQLQLQQERIGELTSELMERLEALGLDQAPGEEQQPPPPVPLLEDVDGQPGLDPRSEVAWWARLASLAWYSYKSESYFTDAWSAWDPKVITVKDVQVVTITGYDRLAVCFRGTNNGGNVVSDFKAWKVPFLFNDDCYVHKGFKEEYLLLAGKLKEHLREQKNRGTFEKLFICGHSLGGAMAQLCAMELGRDRDFTMDRLVTFGSPRVGDSTYTSWCKLYWPHNGDPSGHRRYVNHGDGVPGSPPKAMGFEHYGARFRLKYGKWNSGVSEAASDNDIENELQHFLAMSDDELQEEFGLGASYAGHAIYNYWKVLDELAKRH